MRPIALLRRAAKWLATLLALLVVAAFCYEHVAAWRDARVLTQIGRSVDIGGRTLNIHCRGDGGPTVVLVSGRTAPGYTWTPSARVIAAFTRVCWYDRADIGWSDAGPDPAWGDQAVRDLHALVGNAGLERPLVLVGHSFGGYIIRLYHHTYPGEVAGMVLVDAAHEDAGTIAGMPHRERPKVPRWLIRSLSHGMGHLGMMRAMASDPGPPPPQWTTEEWDIFARLRRQRNMAMADAKVGPESATADLVRATGGLEDMPMVVLTQGRAIRDPNSVEAGVRRGWIDLQRQLAERSRGRHVIVPNAGHGIPVEAPDAVIAAVREVVDVVCGPPLQIHEATSRHSVVRCGVQSAR
jgi:pimeloyl-ACP methyl ester carboxylesterase